MGWEWSQNAQVVNYDKLLEESEGLCSPEMYSIYSQRAPIHETYESDQEDSVATENNRGERESGP